MLTLLRMLRNIPERKLVRLFVFPVMAVRSQSCRQQDTSHTSKGFQKSHETKYYTQFSFILANFVNSPRVITVNPTSVDDNDGIAGIFEIILELSKSSTRLTSTQLRFHSPWKLPPPHPSRGDATVSGSLVPISLVNREGKSTGARFFACLGRIRSLLLVANEYVW